MRPELVAFFARHGIPSWLAPDYMVIVGLSSLACAVYVLRLAREDGVAVHQQARALALAYVVAIPGGYLLEALRAVPSAIAQGDLEPIANAGRAAYGGLLAAVGTATLYLRRHRQPIGPFLDRIAVPAGVIFGAVRTGCFLAGCDYGVVTSSRLGVRFPAQSLAAIDHAARGLVPAGAASLPVHATELYEAVVALVAALFVSRVPRGDGRRFATWLAIYATGRFFVEHLRGDAERGLYSGLSTAQWVSLAVVTGLVVVYARRRAAIAAAVLFFGSDASANQDNRPGSTPDGYPHYTPPPPIIPATKPSTPRPEKTLDTRLVIAPSLVLARKDVSSGAAFEAQALCRIPTSAKTRFGIGGELRAFSSVLAAHYTAAVPFQFVIEASRRIDIPFTFALTHTWIDFKSPFFTGATAWGTRWEVGFQILLGNYAMLGFSPFSFNVISGEDIGVITSYEPRIWFGMSF